MPYRQMTDNLSVHPLTAARIAQGLSRTDLASRSGMSLRAIERLEDDAHTPHRATRQVIAMALGCQPSDIWPDLELAA